MTPPTNMNESALHNQTAESILSELGKHPSTSSSSLVPELLALFDTKIIQPLNNTTIKANQKIYGRDGWDTPILSDSDLVLPWPKERFPDLKGVRYQLMMEVDKGAYTLSMLEQWQSGSDDTPEAQRTQTPSGKDIGEVQRLSSAFTPVPEPKNVSTIISKADVAGALKTAPKTSAPAVDEGQHERCKRCRSMKKGCDRQRPCSRYKERGIDAKGCENGTSGKNSQKMTQGMPILHNKARDPRPAALRSTQDPASTGQEELEEPEETDETYEHEIASNLVANLDDPNYMVQGSLHNIKLPMLDRSARKQDWEEDGNLGVSEFQIAVRPAADSVDLDCTDVWQLSTLLQGSLLWIISAPTSENMDIVQQRFANHSIRANSDTWDDIKKTGGTFAFIQRPGQVVVIPPCCPFTNFSIETSVSADYRIATAKKLHLGLRHIPIFLERLQAYDEPSTRQTLIVAKAEAFQQALALILTNGLPGYNSKESVIQLCRQWPELKDKVRGLCEAIEDRNTSRSIQDTFVETWTRFLKEKTRHKQECRLCHIPKAGMKESWELHFEHVRWNAASTDADKKRKLAGVEDAGLLEGEGSAGEVEIAKKARRRR